MSDLQIPGLESLAFAWAARGWLALLAFTAAVLIVAVLRRPCRRWFGAQRAFQLWLLPPLALLASQLPHAAAAPAPLPPLVYTITSAVGAAMPRADHAGDFDWRTAALLLWSAGVAVVLAVAVAAQRRYRGRLRGATPMAGGAAPRPVLRAASADVGPALVGAWRSRIVLPADFAERYDTAEQALILAHESAHARRGDGWWNLLAQALLAPFWFHPLAWWALAALRHDQELACDAAVLCEHGAQRRNYANAMLKTQSAAFALPVGCAWSPRHPLTERIAMLKQQPISSLRRYSGGVTLALLIATMAGAAYAATTPAAAHASPTSMPDRYALKLDVSFDGKAPSQHFKLCLKPGEYAHVNGVSTGAPAWNGRITVLPAAKGQIEVRGDFSGGSLGEKDVHPIIRTLPGRQATILIGRRVDGKPGGASDAGKGTSIKLDMTPTLGC
jgi:beta-lactamase regulating signal transducer with metallopeptidase domain